MTYNNDWKPTEINEGQPTNWEPKRQTNEEVDEGLRNAFRQAIKDGVMDATPYLKQMTFNTDIQKTEAEIKVLQKKLELLKEIETHKSQPPRMNLQYTVKGEVVSYNDEVYYRLDFAGMNHNWYKKKTDNGVILVKITDGETYRLLEGVWFNDVKHGKYDDVVDEPYRNVRAYWDEKDNPKPMDEVVNRLIKKYQAQKLFNRLVDELGYDFDACNDIVDLVESWLPKEQSAAGSQNVDTELLVDGFNDCLRKIKGMLR